MTIGEWVVRATQFEQGDVRRYAVQHADGRTGIMLLVAARPAAEDALERQVAGLEVLDAGKDTFDNIYVVHALPRPAPRVAARAAMPIDLRALTVLVVAAGAAMAAARGYQAETFKRALVEALYNREAARYVMDKATFFALGALALLLFTFVPWVYCAARNAHRISKDRPRMSPAICAIGVAIPYVNVLVIGFVMNEIWRHSSEERRGLDPFAIVLGLYLIAWILVSVTANDEATVYAAAWMGAGVPVLGTICVLRIDRAQRHARRRLLARAV